MQIKHTLALLAGLGLSSCMSFDLYGIRVERNDISSQKGYQSLARKKLKTQRPYYLDNDFKLKDYQVSRILRIPKGTSFSLTKVEQIYTTVGTQPRQYQGDVATLSFPHLEGMKLMNPITFTLRDRDHIYPAPWQSAKTPTYYVDREGNQWQAQE